MSDTQPTQPTTIFTDPRVTKVTGGGSHDWIHTATMEDAQALIEEYQPNVKYLPLLTSDGVEFAIR